MSDRSTSPTLVPDDDPSRLFKAFVADINFRLSKEGMESWKVKRPLVYDLVQGGGPSAIMENTRPQVRWIHLPANTMVWVEVQSSLPGEIHGLTTCRTWSKS